MLPPSWRTRYYWVTLLIGPAQTQKDCWWEERSLFSPPVHFQQLFWAAALPEVGSGALLGHLHCQTCSVVLPFHRIGLWRPLDAGPDLPISPTPCFHLSHIPLYSGSTKSLQSNCKLTTCLFQCHLTAQEAIKRQWDKYESGPVNSGRLILIVLEEIRKRSIRYQCWNVT